MAKNRAFSDTFDSIYKNTWKFENAILVDEAFCQSFYSHEKFFRFGPNEATSNWHRFWCSSRFLVQHAVAVYSSKSDYSIAEEPYFDFELLFW
jgi:hypothetical protein